MEILLENRGLAMENLTYEAVIENESLVDYEGRVGFKQIWNRTVNVTRETKRLSAELATIGGSRYSEVALVLEDPDGMASEEHADLGSGYLGPVEVSNPQAGRWLINVYGYNVPEAGQPFRLTVKQYSEEPWSWITASGPERLEAGSNGTVQASLAIPRNPAQHQLEGYIKIQANNSSIEIPVSVSLAGSELLGLSSEEVLDEDNDGRHDQLVLGFGVNVTIPDEFRLEGVANDCQGRRISVIDQSQRLDDDGVIQVNISGTDIWRAAKCSPVKIENLVLYDNAGNHLDRYEEDINIDRDPKEFQAPPAYISGFVNQTTPEAIAIGVNLSVTKPGAYRIAGAILDDSGEEIGYESIEERLNPGNYTLSLKFSPSDFMTNEEISRVRLVDLILTSSEVELEEIDLAWSSEEMDPQGFEADAGVSRASQDFAAPEGSDSDEFPFPAAAGAVLRRENGTAVIS